jgi:hypothetical protein
MPRTSTEHKVETVTFRLDPSLKAGLADVARDEAKPVGEVLRELVRECIERKRHEAFLAEARRQSEAIAARARDPESDESQVLRELEASFDELGDEWR